MNEYDKSSNVKLNFYELSVSRTGVYGSKEIGSVNIGRGKEGFYMKNDKEKIQFKYYLVYSVNIQYTLLIQN